MLLPLISFFVLFTTGRWLKPKVGGYIATGAIVAAGLLSSGSLAIWLNQHPVHAEAQLASARRNGREPLPRSTASLVDCRTSRIARVKSA